MKKIVCVSLSFPGVKATFENGKNIGLWDFKEVKEKGEKLELPKADIYIWGSWTHLTVKELPKNAMNIVFWSSSCAETGIQQNEVTLLAQILADDRINKIWFVDPALANCFDKGFYAPHPIAETKPKNVEKRNYITMLQPPSLKKNQFGQLVAVKLLQKERDIKLYTNLAAYESILKWLKIDYKILPWMDKNTYFNVLEYAKANLSCSFTEAFCYQVSEASFLKTPSVVSPAVEWYDKELMANPDNPMEIKEKIEYILDHPELQNRVREHVMKIKDRNNAMLKKVFERF